MRLDKADVWNIRFCKSRSDLSPFQSQTALRTNAATLRDSQFVLAEATDVQLKALVLMSTALHGYGLQWWHEVLGDDKSFMELVVTLSGAELELASDRLKHKGTSDGAYSLRFKLN